MNEICHKEGLAGLYRGLKVDLVRVLPANTITFVVYEHCKSLLMGLNKSQSELLHWSILYFKIIFLILIIPKDTSPIHNIWE